ncbi:hypothetical protein BLAT2472_50051 [Burkholderia latens]
MLYGMARRDGALTADTRQFHCGAGRHDGIIRDGWYPDHAKRHAKNQSCIILLVHVSFVRTTVLN